LITPPPITRAVFLDVGGTLLTSGDPVPAYLDILRTHGYDVSMDQVREWLGLAREEARHVPGGPAEDFTISADQERARRAAMVDAFLRHAGVHELHLDSVHSDIWASWVGTGVFGLYGETLSVLAHLKQAGFVLGAVSNWEPRLERLCASHGIADYLDFIIASEAEGFAKPGPRLFEMALERAEVTSEEVIHVGDSPREDVQAAEALGIRGVLLERNGERRFAHSPMIRSLEQVIPLAKARAWLRGCVERGKGEAAGFTNIDWVRAQVAERLGFNLHPGTLNLRLTEARDLASWAWLAAQPGVPIEPSPGFCAARCYPVTVEGQWQGAIILPLVRGYPPDVVEVLAPVALRDALGLAEGAAVTLGVLGGEPERVS
jgi:FMN phosphatase YigB (HAD superfamily)